MRYFPFTQPVYEMSFGIRALADGEPIFERDEHYGHEIALKRQLLAEDRSYCFRGMPGSEPAQQEVARFVCAQVGAVPTADLNEAGLQVQEDLLVLSPLQGFPLIAGQLCFPNGWSLPEKLGLPLLAIHDPVPGFARQLGARTLALHERLKAGRPVVRLNWGLKPLGDLDQSTRRNDKIRAAGLAVDVENAGERCHFRIERQTLTRMPETSAILFALHTYQSRIVDLSDEERGLLEGVLRTAPQDMLAYKGIAPFVAPLLEWLRNAKGALAG